MRTTVTLDDELLESASIAIGVTERYLPMKRK